MIVPGWYLPEEEHAGAEHYDPAYVAGYDRKAQTDVSADLQLLRSLGLNGAATLVDLGAGTGSFAVAAAEYGHRVVAVDPSPAMLAAIRKRVSDTGSVNVECVGAGFLSFEAEPASVDFVYSRHALHHVPDFWKGIALTRVAAMLKPGGIFRLRDLIFSFPPEQADQAIESWLASAVTDSRDGWTRSELEAHLREEHSTYSWLLEPLLAQVGLAIEKAEYSASRIYAAYVCRKLRHSDSRIA